MRYNGPGVGTAIWRPGRFPRVETVWPRAEMRPRLGPTEGNRSPAGLIHVKVAGPPRVGRRGEGSSQTVYVAWD